MVLTFEVVLTLKVMISEVVLTIGVVLTIERAYNRARTVVPFTHGLSVVVHPIGGQTIIID